MATRSAVIANPNQYLNDDNEFRTVTWTGLLNTDDGEAVQLPSFSDRSVQVLGTFGTGGTLLFEGSNNNSNWSTIRDVLGTDISLTAAGLRTPLDLPWYVRPRVSAGDGTTNLSVILLVRKQTDT